MDSRLDLTHTLRSDDIGPLNPNGSTSTQVPETLCELQEQRMVRTNDTRGVAYSFGNRATRRMVGRNGGTGGKPKQYHKAQ